MSEKKEINNKKNGFLFNIDVLIAGKTNGHALELLTHLLNTDEVTDYRIIKGINLGQIIEASLAPKTEKLAQPKSETKASPKVSHKPIIKQIEQFKEDRTLVRISVIKAKGVKLSIPCRILNYDWSTGNITAYHVDEKKVYSIDLNEIDDLTTG